MATDTASTTDNTPTPPTQPAIKFKSKPKLSARTTARSGTLLDVTPADTGGTAAGDDDGTNQLSIEQLRALQQLRQTLPVSHTPSTAQSATKQPKPPANSNRSGGSEQVFEGSAEERLKIQQMNAYIEQQLAARQRPPPSTTCTNTAPPPSSASTAAKSSLYEPDGMLKQALKASNVHAANKDTETSYNWLAGISEIPLSDTERAANARRNEKAKQQIEQQAAQQMHAGNGEQTVMNYNSNYQQHQQQRKQKFQDAKAQRQREAADADEADTKKPKV